MTTLTIRGRRSYGGGKIAVLAIIAIALVAASFAWWWNFNRGRKVMAFFGPRAAHLIRTAPKVEILVIGGPESAAGPGSTDDKIKLNNFTYSVFKRIDISKASGLIHARRRCRRFELCQGAGEEQVSLAHRDCAVR
jgi:hypothetical protein